MSITSGKLSFSNINLESYSISKNINHNVKTIKYNQPFIYQPLLFTKLSSFNGKDTCNTRIIDSNNKSFKIKVQEDQSKDKEMSHINENFNYFSILIL